MSNYAEKLKDPRWQKRRLEIMERDKWACQKCGSKEDTLHVHHVNYNKGAAPWEYDDKELVTFCLACHEDIEERIRAFRRFVATMPHKKIFLVPCMSEKQADIFGNLVDAVVGLMDEHQQRIGGQS